MNTHLVSLIRSSPPWLLAAATACAVLAAASSCRSTTELHPEPTTVEHRGVFSYTAPASPSIVYPDGSIETGDPIFRAASGTLRVRYEHQIEAEADPVVSGALTGEVSLRVGSWDHALDSVGPVELVDGRGAIDTTLDLSQVDELVRQYRVVSGSEPAEVVVSIEPAVTGDVDGGPNPVPTQAAARLELTVTPTQVDVAPGQLGPTTAQAIHVLRPRPSRVGFLGWDIAVVQGRTWGSIGASISALLLVSVLVLRRRRPDREVARTIAVERSVQVAALDQLSDVVDVLDERTFHQMAASGTSEVLLRSVDRRGVHTFVFDDGRLRYRYTAPEPS
jgi:hypothetical protein